MERREALKYTASIMGVSIIGADVFLSGCQSSNISEGYLSKEEVELLDEIGEIILPESDRSPGAKSVQIGEFMESIVSDCYSKEDQQIFRSGLKEIQKSSKQEYAREFLKLNSKERFDLISYFDNLARQNSTEDQVHFFTMIKQLTIWGYFSSEAGVTKALRYDPIPGGYDGCVKYQEGDKAWQGPLSSLG